MKNFEILKPCKKNLYEIILEEDLNDGDLITIKSTLNKEEFESDELFQLVLCYCKMSPGWEARFGQWFEKNKELPWLCDYLEDSGLIAHDEWGSAHSITDIIITYFDSNSVAHPVNLNTLDFTKDTLAHMTYLYQK